MLYPKLSSLLSSLFLLGAASGVVGNLFPDPIPTGVIPRKTDPFSGTVNAFFALVPLPVSLLNSTVPSGVELAYNTSTLGEEDAFYGPYARELPKDEVYILVQLGKEINAGWTNIHSSLKNFNEVKITLPWASRVSSTGNTTTHQPIRLAHWTDDPKQRKRIPHSVHAPVDLGSINATETFYNLSTGTTPGIASANFTAEPISSTTASTTFSAFPPILMQALEGRVVGLSALNEEFYAYRATAAAQLIHANLTLSTKLWNRYDESPQFITLPVIGYKASFDWTMHHQPYEWND
ncbi:MAG: hypothetical protein DHS80DRAFT_22687 [Piptocephalis tieghemiana]|nr:MAG: hypothetical protein DHS80DRAFT_22687 [Piptocephalis tieghemiana]